MNGTSKGSSRWHFPCCPQQRISDPPVKHAAWGERRISATQPHHWPLAFLLTISSRCPFWQQLNSSVIGMHGKGDQGWIHQVSSFQPLSSSLKVSAFQLLEQLLWFWTSGLLATSSGILLPIHKSFCSSEHMHTCKKLEANDCESPSDRDMTFACVGYTVGYSRNWR